MLYHFDEAAIYIISTLIVLLIILAFTKRSFSYLLFFSIFGIYIINVINLVIFPIWIPTPEAATILERLQHNVNLIPFRFGDCYFAEICQAQIINNILLTIPFGFGICFITPLKAPDFRWLPPTVGLGLEISQFVISQGGFHAFDVNDIILNATGLIIGYILFRIFGWLYRGAIHMGSGDVIFAILAKVMGPFAGPLLGMFLLGLWSKRARSTDVIAGAVLGVVATVGVTRLTTIHWLWYYVAGTVVALAAGWLFSLVRPGPAIRP